MSGGALARKVSLPLLTFYGLGTILGAGIYVLIGEVSQRAGPFAPLSFLLAAIIAAITAYSFARLSSIFPKSAGEAAYAHAAFNKRSLSSIVGLAVVLIGTVSAATMIKGFSGYFISFIQIPENLVIVLVIIFITSLSIWGINQSLLVASCITIIEVLGLCFVIYAIADLSEFNNYNFPFDELNISSSSLIIYAAFISFYAYIGFEDIVNIAEETIHPEKVVPLAISFSLIISTLLYLALSISCTIFIPSEVFNTSSAPLVSIVEYKGYNPIVMGIISMIAILNGALVQLIMASRVLYGMSDQKLIVSVFKRVNKSTHTPVLATITIALFLIILSTTLELISLAEITSAITLIVFMLVQASLLFYAIKISSTRKLDFIIPAIGILLNIILLFFGYSKIFQNLY